MSTPRERCDEVGKKVTGESDVIDRMGTRRQLVSTAGTVVGVGTGLNTITPCAACKLLRRRCAQECPFSPYFSPHEPQRFASVHKVFGASNVSKMLMEVPEAQRADAANSLVYEANVRLRDPVYGCMGAIIGLQQQVQALEAELNAVRAEILKHKFRQQANNSNNNPTTSYTTTAAVVVFNQSPQLVSLAALPSIASSPQAALVQPLPAAPSPSTASSMYTAAPSTSSNDYSTITNENIPYLG